MREESTDGAGEARHQKLGKSKSTSKRSFSKDEVSTRGTLEGPLISTPVRRCSHQNNGFYPWQSITKPPLVGLLDVGGCRSLRCPIHRRNKMTSGWAFNAGGCWTTSKSPKNIRTRKTWQKARRFSKTARLRYSATRPPAPRAHPAIRTFASF